MRTTVYQQLKSVYKRKEGRREKNEDRNYYKIITSDCIL